MGSKQFVPVLPKNSRDGGGGRSHGTCGVPDLRNKMRGVPDGCVEGGGLRKEKTIVGKFCLYLKVLF